MSIKNIPYYIMSLTVGIVFLISAYAKLDPVTDLIDNVYSRFTISYMWATTLSKALIGLEIALGLLFISMIYGLRKWVLHVSMYMLIAFTLFIVYIWYTEGSEADCGCMGTLVKISPLWSIVKNVVLMAFIGALCTWQRVASRAKHYFALISTVILIFYPIVFFANEFPNEAIKQDKFSAQSLPVSSDKKLFVFATVGCPHCREAGKLLAEAKAKDSKLPIYLIFPNRDVPQEEYLKDYMDDTKATNIPTYIMDADLFRKIAGRGVPSLLVVKDSEIVDKVDNYRILSVGKLHQILK